MSIVDTTTGEVVARSLDECEQVIEAGMTTFIEVGNALAEVRDHRLYRDDYSSFDDYCAERWGWDRKRASEFILAAEVSEISDSPIRSEAHASALAPLRDDPDALNAAIETAIAQAEADGAKLTAKRIKDAVAQIARDGGSLDSESSEAGDAPVSTPAPSLAPVPNDGRSEHPSQFAGEGASAHSGPPSPATPEPTGTPSVGSTPDVSSPGTSGDTLDEAARLRILASNELKKASGFWHLIEPEQFHEINDPTITEQLRLHLEVVNRWCDRYKATKPAGLRVVEGGKK